MRLDITPVDALGNLDATSLGLTARLTAGTGPADRCLSGCEVTEAVELTRTAPAKDKMVEAGDRGDLEEELRNWQRPRPRRTRRFRGRSRRGS